MLKVIVSQVGCDAITGNAVVLLNEPGCEKILPIWIGAPEATAISWALQHVKTERPLTHQLMFNVINALNYSVEKVEISEIKNQAFLARLYLSGKAESENPESLPQTEETRSSKVIDARPSDAIALAILGSAPIYVATDVFEQAAVSTKQEGPDGGNSKPKSPEQLAAEDADFKQFLQGVKASDFILPGEQK